MRRGRGGGGLGVGKGGLGFEGGERKGVWGELRFKGNGMGWDRLMMIS